jgi:hypothetical protein
VPGERREGGVIQDCDHEGERYYYTT